MRSIGRPPAADAPMMSARSSIDAPIPSPVPGAFSSTSIGIRWSVVRGFGSRAHPPPRKRGSCLRRGAECLRRGRSPRCEPMCMTTNLAPYWAPTGSSFATVLIDFSQKSSLPPHRLMRYGAWTAMWSIPAASSRARNSGSALGGCWPAAPRGRVVGEDLDSRRADLPSAIRGLEHPLSEGQVGADQSAVRVVRHCEPDAMRAARIPPRSDPMAGHSLSHGRI